MKDRDELQDALMKNLPADLNKPQLPAEVQQNKDIRDDYDYSRKTYRELIDKGSMAMDSMMELAVDSEHPRAFEVLSGMMKNMADITDKLMDLQKKKDDIETKKEAKQPSSGGVTNNNVFVGSTTDLQRMLSKGDVIDGDATE